jgi:hypothetical protein
MKSKVENQFNSFTFQSLSTVLFVIMICWGVPAIPIFLTLLFNLSYLNFGLLWGSGVAIISLVYCWTNLVIKDKYGENDKHKNFNKFIFKNSYNVYLREKNK